MKTSLIFIKIFCIFICLTFITGCFYKAPVRHLASDMGLAVAGQTTQKEIISYMGFPDIKKNNADGIEEWLYFQGNDSLMRKAPLLGDKMGETNYDVGIIIFQDQIVKESKYRSFTEEEFRQLGIPENDPE